MKTRKSMGMARTPRPQESHGLLYGALALGIAGLAGCGGGNTTVAPATGSGPVTPPAITVQSLSSPEKMTSGSDTLVQLTSADGAAVAGVKVRLNGADVTAQFQKAASGNASLALLTGLQQGDNTIEVRDASDDTKVRGSLKLTAYPVQGPILYAPQEGNLHCQTDAFTVYPGGPTLTSAPNTDPNCAAPTRVDWVYHDKTRAGTAVWQKYDPANPPTVVEQTTLLDGRTVPYIVRIETGVINRGIYQTAVLGDPVGNPNPSALKPPSGFNGRLVYPFGQSCGGGWYVQGTSMGPVGGSNNSSNGASGDFNALNDLPLSKGFAVANSTLNYFGQNCNHIISAETMMMVKERFIKANGPLLYTMGWGNSGSAMQQSMIADTYPGLLDGIVMLNGFPDNSGPQSMEGRLFYNYQLNYTKGGTTQNGTFSPLPNSVYDPTYDNATAAARAANATLPTWTNAELAAASGYSTYHSIRQQASFWAARTDNVLRPANQGDRDNVMAGTGNSAVFNAVIGANEKYSPAGVVTSAPMGVLPAPAVSLLPARPNGLRPNVTDHNKNVLGVDPATGYGRTYIGNAGVQFGLNALNTGQITMAQFIHLNQNIGGQDADGNLRTSRMQPDPEALRNAYQTGMIMYGGAGMASTAVLDLDGLNNEFTGAGDMHLKFFHYILRARIAAATGKYDNHVMWNGMANVAAFTQDPNANHLTPVQAPRPAKTGRTVIVMQKAFLGMDQWLTALAADRSADTLARKVVKNKPAAMVDGCYGATTPGAADDFIAEPQTFGGFNTVFINGNGNGSPAGTVGTGATPSRCNAMFPASSFPRFEAGEPLQSRSMQCQFRPVTAADYAGYATRNPGWTGSTRDADLASLRAVFPSGVCDYSKPGLQEQPLGGTWIQVTGTNQIRFGHPLGQ
ncbi:hypothetical protein GT347_08405 [Xylophilus rhododendri]|uniref:DUF6351 domain-containing protein n=1 Tax=Xylophilus rhododendri TaxID=2697032 RepID=A0A857J5A3_9BURK|nr:DUF6351 family protein [Xylophilus rhododendri]QHI98015.1 hypothetical protein GT347_08405 [Xylophilus rhododendri]